MSTPPAIPISLVSADALPAWLEAHPQHRPWLQATGFRARNGSFALLPDAAGQLARVIAAPADEAPVWALAALPTKLPEGTYRLDTPLPPERATAAALGWALASYAFTRYRSAKRQPAVLEPPEGADMAEVARLQWAMGLARDLVNTPAEHMGPAELAAAAEALAQRTGATIRVIRGDDLLAENYPTVHAVGRASTRPPLLIDLRWGDESAPKVTLVGKGVCFDTGGLDLKPAAGMLQMKKDMGGAAVVLGLAQALIDAKAPIRLRVLVPAVENAVAGNAIRPRDIVRTRSGKTVEIGNTDAEGRLILCDALWEAASEKPELLVDVATLTGAARVALGTELQALFCDDDATAQALQQAGTDTGDPLWRLPVWRPYLKQIEGDIADLKNVSGGPHGGAIVAAVYLAQFVAGAGTWVHLDVGGSNDKARPGRPEGGEATGLRPLYTYIRRRFG